MSSKKQKLRLAAALAALAMLALAVSCRGFFVNPTLTAITISPSTPQVEVDTTLVPPLSIYGTYSDGSTAVVSSGVSWSSDTPSVATISAAGSLAGVSLGTATITASAQAVTATATATVYLGGISAISVSPTSGSVDNQNTVVTANFVFTATANGQPEVITTDNGGILTITPTTSGVDLSCIASVDTEVCSTDGNAVPGSYSVIMTYPGTNASATATLTVTGTQTGAIQQPAGAAH
jgi:hypothetical protein